MPCGAFQLLSDFLCFLVVYPYDVVFSSCCEVFSIWMVVHCQNVIFFLCCLPYLFARFGCKLIKVTICASNQNNWTHGRVLVLWSPPQTIDRNIFFGFWIDIDLTNLVVGTQIIYSHYTVTVTACCHGILVTETGNHQFCLLWNDWLDQKLVFKRYLL